MKQMEQRLTVCCAKQTWEGAKCIRESPLDQVLLLLILTLSCSLSVMFLSLFLRLSPRCPLTFMCFSLSMPSWWEHSQREQSCVVCGNGAELSGAEMAGEIANCALLRDNIVMLDYPSACWHCPASPWTHNPAEKQPTANGVFYGGLFSAYTVQSGITFTCAC